MYCFKWLPFDLHRILQAIICIRVTATVEMLFEINIVKLESWYLDGK